MFSFPINHISGAASPPPAPSYVESVQYATISIASGATTGTATISSVDTSRTIIFFNGSTISSGDAGTGLARVNVTNSTTITATRNTSNTNVLTVDICIVQFVATAISSIQSGNLTLTATTSNTAAISSVNTSRSVVLLLGHTCTNATTTLTTNNPTITLTNSTTVTANRAVGTGNITLSYMVVEFAVGVVQSVQSRSVVQSAAGTTLNDTISSVTPADTILIPQGARCTTTTAGTVGSFYNSLTLANSTTVTLTRAASSTTSRTHNYTVLQFASGVLSTKQGGVAVVSTGNNVNTTVTSVGSLAILATSGFSTDAIYEGTPRTTKTNATTLNTRIGLSNAAVAGHGWQLIEFTP